MQQVSWKLNLAMLWLSQVAVLAGFNAFIPYIPLFIKDELGVTDPAALAAAIAAFNFFGQLAYATFNPIWGVLSDRFGVKPMLLRGTFLTAVIFPLMAYSKTVAMLVFLRFLSAACAGTTAASNTMIVRNTPDDKQGFALGVLSTAYWGGSMLGFVIGGFLIKFFSYQKTFWACGILYFVAGISILFTRDGTIRAPMSTIHHLKARGLAVLMPRFTRAVWIMFMLFLVLGFIRSFEIGYIALTVEELVGKADAAIWTGVISAAVALAAVISGIVSGYLVDRISFRLLLIPCMFISAAALVMQGAPETSFLRNYELVKNYGLVIFAAGRVLLYITAAGLSPILQKLLSAATPTRKRGSVFGFSTTAQCGGNMLAFVVSGYAYYHLVVCGVGVSGIYYVAAVLFVAALPLFLHGITLAFRRRPFHRA